MPAQVCAGYGSAQVCPVYGSDQDLVQAQDPVQSLNSLVYCHVMCWMDSTFPCNLLTIISQQILGQSNQDSKYLSSFSSSNISSPNSSFSYQSWSSVSSSLSCLWVSSNSSSSLCSSPVSSLFSILQCDVLNGFNLSMQSIDNYFSTIFLVIFDPS